MRDRHTQLILSPSLEHFLRGDHSALLPSSLRFPVYHSFRMVQLNSSLAMKLPIAVVFVLTVYVLDSAAAGWEHISEMNLEDFAVKECNYTISNADDLTKYISSPSRKLCCQFSHVIQCSKNFLLKKCGWECHPPEWDRILSALCADVIDPTGMFVCAVDSFYYGNLFWVGIGTISIVVYALATLFAALKVFFFM